MYHIHTEQDWDHYTWQIMQIYYLRISFFILIFWPSYLKIHVNNAMNLKHESAYNEKVMLNKFFEPWK